MDRTSVSLFFPVYKDEGTVRVVTDKAMKLLDSLHIDEYEIIIVDDGSPDRAGEIADELARSSPRVRVIHHPTNLGYGAAIRSGLVASRYGSIWFTDGDDQYDIEDFRKLYRLIDHYDLIVTFRYKKIYSGTRVFISWVYNELVRFLFRTPFRDVSTALRIVRKSVIDDIELETTSPFIGAELAIKAVLRGYRVGEVGIQMFPRVSGEGSSTSWRNIRATIRDMWRTYKKIFSDEYDLPPSRPRVRTTRADPAITRAQDVGSR